jgi:hypothetical protein
MTCTNQKTGKLIGGYELGLLSKEEKRRFETHLQDCEHCFQSLYQTAPLAILMREGKVAPEGEFELTEEEEGEAVKKEPSSSTGFGSTLRRPWIYAAAMALLVITLTAVWLLGPGKKTERLRGHDEISILVLSPVGEVTAIREFKWKAIAGVGLYEFKLYNETGDLVWEEYVEDSTSILPDSVNKTLIPGRAYAWQVEALTAKGDRLKSQLIQFIIRK